MNDVPSTRSRSDLYYAWLVVGAVCAALMWARPGEGTIPYHIAWASFAVLYGLGNWRLRRAATGLALYTLATGAILVIHAATGLLAWQETAEIPLMSILMVVVVRNVQRRQLALGAVTVLAERERAQARDRERLTRLTSHELRTPLTIARGYVELLGARETDPQQLRDLAVVVDELDRLTRVTERLVRVMRLQGGSELDQVDLDLVLAQTVERWAQLTDRNWLVETDAGTYEGSGERLRASLDTLIENAVRYTADGEMIRVTARRADGLIEISVADSGPGLSDELIAVINGDTPSDIEVPRDDLSQTGLGLGLVRSIAVARGGRLFAGTSPEGGALLRMEIPVGSAMGPLLTELPGLNAAVSESASGPASVGTRPSGIAA